LWRLFSSRSVARVLVIPHFSHPKKAIKKLKNATTWLAKWPFNYFPNKPVEFFIFSTQTVVKVFSFKALPGH
jgi:hypothetical protein